MNDDEVSTKKVDTKTKDKEESTRAPAFSLIIPVYKNEGSISELCTRVQEIASRLPASMEAVFVVDGSPDRSYLLLDQALGTLKIPSQLIELSRNFGSFAAIRMGLEVARGRFFSVMAADLQEPAQVIVSFFTALWNDEADIAVGSRAGRAGDPFWSAQSARLFWWLYRRLVQKEVPPGGVDVFGCNLRVRDILLRLEESRTSMVGLLFWMGFRRKNFPYHRQERRHGKSGWSFSRKLDYLFDSCFSFSELPVKLLIWIGVGGIIVAVCACVAILIAYLLGSVTVPGYVPIMLAILFSFAILMLAIGIVGTYAWRAYENTKARPPYFALRHTSFGSHDEARTIETRATL